LAKKVRRDLCPTESPTKHVMKTKLFKIIISFMLQQTKKKLSKIHNEINRAISGFRPRGSRICNGRESDKECPITRMSGKSGTPRHAGHVSPIIYESITYLLNFWSTRRKLSVRSAPYNIV